MTDHAYYAAPKFSVWRWLGFGECSAPLFDDLENENGEMEGYALSRFIVGTKARLDWRDRLRALVSGKVMVEVSCKTDVLIKRSMARSSFSILPPNAKIGP